MTTDGFLYPNQQLIEKGILNRKGFPESYDAKRLIHFLSAVKSGAPKITVPVYSHLVYDVLPDDQQQIIEQPDILIVEGINVLQVNSQRPARDIVFSFPISSIIPSMYMPVRKPHRMVYQ
ncbi:hypothetical protein KUH03_37470 [Sphingobacterium sp. E70]|uniref:hypothetical protein n=1 Tax=Sphingobacterium sp. E70 TaxID=2853439 RepID=UPI00211C861F|nr:hypothetical protein [Sphingobacterium sp. E70]ULT24577.1 hypothetical protein KUH03_37470 [Sphingobacterium sp. E70]